MPRALEPDVALFEVGHTRFGRFIEQAQDIDYGGVRVGRGIIHGCILIEIWTHVQTLAVHQPGTAAM